MILRHRDTDVLRFDWVEPFGVRNVELNRGNGHSRFSQAISEERLIRVGSDKTDYWQVIEPPEERKTPYGDMAFLRELA